MNDCVDERKRVDMSELGANKKCAVNATECVDTIGRRCDQKHWYHRDSRDTIKRIDAIEKSRVPVRAKTLSSIQSNRDLCGVNECVDGSERRCE